MKSTLTGSVCIVGKGRWGSSLQAALNRQGRSPLAISRRDLQVARKTPVKEALWQQCEIFWLCVPDAEIARVADRLARILTRKYGPLRGRIVLHSSGVLDSEVLKALKHAGAQVASVHPLMSFPTRRPVDLKDVPFAVEATGSLRTRLFGMVRQLGGQPFAIRLRARRCIMRPR